MDWKDLPRRLVPEPVRRLIQQSEPYHSTVAFLAGFGYDSATLRRIDQLLDNLLLLLYLVGLGFLLVLERRLAHGRPSWKWVERNAHWLEVGIQFLFGGLYSAYVIFYFKSASAGQSFLFLLLLAALLVANEYLGKKIRLERLQLALYFFCVFSFLLYFVPVVSGWMGNGIFLLAGVGALLILAGVTWLVYRDVALGDALEEGTERPVRRALRTNGMVWGGLFGGLYLLYVLGVIPPVPLSLVHAGVYHQIKPDLQGYELIYEKPRWYKLWTDDDAPFHLREGDRVHCFSAVFAPKGMQLEIFHRWHRWDEKKGEWQQTDRIPFQVRGGRQGGFRGYTRKQHVSPGRWRVIVETGEEQELGRVNFEIVSGGSPAPAWKTLVY